MHDERRFAGTMHRLAEAIRGVDDLDATQALYVSNATADSAPALQRAVHAMLQDERRRRDGEGDDGTIALPPFGEWPPADWMLAGSILIPAAEAAAMTGEPTQMNFAFRLLQWWFIQVSSQVTEAAYPCPND